ncbi:hypothetical protein CEP54_006709 [Fusarium duplospermum]|uniref:Uncharacterized protein n=1 Tax=Fusarium duplospermum TaxID=1325734 RepID=A0A428Q572_9HYPO|nr:hypothetical protein CEP54_006709 [Fusarium duplospermum]
MGKDDDDIPPAAGLGESHIPPFGSWQPLEFELGFPVEEWGTIGFDDLDFNLPDHLIQGETIHVSESHHQSAVAASSPVTTLDYELANATQPTDELVLARNVNTQSPNGETEEPPDLAGLARHIRPEQSRRFDLTDVIPFRTGNARMGQRNSIFPEPSWLAESTTRTSFITYYFEGVDVNLLPTLKLSCLEFDPTKDAVLSEHYKDVDGNVMVVKSPCVACIDIATPMIRQALEEYMRQICPIAIQEILNTSKDEIYRQGLAEANRLAYASYNPIPMLQKALEILACVHINFDTPILVYLTQCEYLRGATIVNDGVNIFAQASPVTSHMLSMWRASAKYLLYHYRCVMKGTLPFSPSFKLEGAGNALPDADARQYIRKTAALRRS